MGIIGPNGAGKTTLFNVISGYYPPNKGIIEYNNEDITGKPINYIARRGLVRTFQLTQLFMEETLYDSILIAHHIHSNEGILAGVFNTTKAREDRKKIHESTMKIINLLRLTEEKDKKAKNLTYGKQRALGVAIGLAAKPNTILLDEPVTGMNPKETIEFMNIINEIKDKLGITLVIVEHNMKVIMNICKRIIVLNFGKKIAEGNPKEISENEDVITAYLGT